MRHRIAGNRLNRHRSLFKATIRDLAKATIIKEITRGTIRAKQE